MIILLFSKIQRPLSIFFCAALVGCAQKQDKIINKKAHFLQLRVIGSGVKGVRTWVKSKSKHYKIGWLLRTPGGGPAQEVFFHNTDSIQAIFPIGKTIAEKFDTTFLEPSGNLLFEVKIENNRILVDKKYSFSNTKLKVELLADGEVMQQVKFPTIANDSSALLKFDTNKLFD